MTVINRIAIILALLVAILAQNWSAACGWFVACIYAWNKV